MDDLHERLGPLVRRNLQLHALLPRDVKEFCAENLDEKLDTIELVMREILFTTAAMQRLLEESNEK